MIWEVPRKENLSRKHKRDVSLKSEQQFTEMFRKKRLNSVVRKFKAYQEIKGTMRSFCVFDLRCFLCLGFMHFFSLLSMILRLKNER